jgi:hypothetical protein
MATSIRFSSSFSRFQRSNESKGAGQDDANKSDHRRRKILQNRIPFHASLLYTSRNDAVVYPAA